MSENNFLRKTLDDTVLSRRSFLKWSGALGGTAALAGGLNYGFKAVTALAQDTGSEGEWITAACWHNCGGQRCVLKAQVVDGVVQKVKTDDTHPDSMAQPQIRACARGRSQAQHIFGEDRLKYPMKRANWEPGGGKKELRGQDDWVRISWDEALDILASEFTRVKEKYGNESIMKVGGYLSRPVSQLGGAVGTWGTTSWGTWRDTGPKCGLGDGLSFTSHNDRLDMQNAELIVFWGANPAWSAQGNNMSFYLDAKRAGTKFIFVDPLYNDSAMILADEWIPTRPGADHPMLLAMAYTLITEDDPETNPLIDWDFLERCTLGFDENLMPEGVDTKENFKDYVLGTYDGLPKTPEWASEICGVDPEKIRQLAREIGSRNRVTLLTTWSAARTNNSDSWPQMFMTLGAMTGNIGRPGCATGVSCWEKTADGGPALIGSGGGGVPGVDTEGLDQVSIRVNNNQLWNCVLTDEYTAGIDDVQDINIQMIINDGGSALNQKVGMTEGIAAHRKVEFVVSQNFVLSTSCRYSDLVLPVTTQWERYGYMKGNRDHLIWARQVTEPLWEAKDDIWIAKEFGARMGLDPVEIDPVPLNQEIYNRLAGSWVMKEDGSDREPLLTITAEDIAEMGVEGEPQTGRITLQEYKEKGVYTVRREAGDNLGYIAHEAFREDPVANPLENRNAGTPSGLLEIHSQSLADFVNGKGFTEIQPIPTYNRPIEGYEDTFANWNTKEKGEFPLQLFTIHYRRRSHSILDNVPWLRELFPQEFLINPVDAEARGIENGDYVQITSRHGTVLRPAYVTERLFPGVVALGEGAWAQVDEDTGIDVAGATNTLNGAIPTGQGHQGWNTCNVRVEKYEGDIETVPDYKWPQRIVFEEEA
jgi:anaerobic dimethyl sulfoxide reductase subunit A